VRVSDERDGPDHTRVCRRRNCDLGEKSLGVGVAVSESMSQTFLKMAVTPVKSKVNQILIDQRPTSVSSTPPEPPKVWLHFGEVAYWVQVGR
jgi:hypothetical protein